MPDRPAGGLRPRPRYAVYGASAGNPGGTGVYLRRLLEGFAEIGAPSVAVATPSGLVTPREALAMAPPGALGKLLAEQLTIPASIRSSGVRLVHLPAFSGRAPRGAAVAVTVHDLAFLANPSWFPLLRGLWYRLDFPRVARRASLVIADSDFTASELGRRLGIANVKTVHLCARTPAAGGRPAGVEGLCGQYVLFVGTIEPRKNLGALLAAWPAVRSVHPALTLVVAGRWGWGDASLLQRLESLEGCVWTRHLDTERLDAAYAGARLLVYPSLYEGFGLPPLEAACQGVPSVIGPAGSLREVYGAVATPCGSDADSIAAAICTALSAAPDRERLMGFAAGFTPARMAGETLAAYEGCLGGGPG